MVSPFGVTLTPLAAVIAVIDDTDEVVAEGTPAVIEIWPPYLVEPPESII
jgi:hypothetical protein